MPGRLAVDFGTSNTVLALWDETQQQGVPVHLPEFGQIQQQGDETISLIPSLIHYAAENRTWVGQQVNQRGLRQSNRTFRWMKRYISHRSPLKVRIDDREITPYMAGQDFLSTVLVFAAQEVGFREEEVAFSVPVEAFEHYENWLASVAENAGMPRFRLIDEPSAAALGYGAHIQPGNVYLLFDFGGGTMHAAVVLIESEANATSGRRCRVLGKSGRDIGGTTIDQWIFQEVLRQNHRRDTDDEDVRRISTALLVECEKVKERLTFDESADLTVVNPETGAVLAAEFTRSSFEDLLDQHDLFTDINHTVRAALNSAAERGYDESTIQAALMVGGSSMIPSVQRTLRQIFGRERVRFNRPLDAVARGAAAFVAGVDFYDHIQHDYAIRFVNPQKGKHDFRTIVNRGTPYPTREPVARLAIKASFDNQRHLGIEIFELSEQRQRNSNPVELIFDPNGAARIRPLTPDVQERRSMFWMNEDNRTFLTAEPPAKHGESRFEVEFQIDENKRLTITARDLVTGRLTHKDYPVVKLT